ncbi:MAG: small ribosomal subunit Rsm22 family protein [Gemmatimonadales bacterium]|nr:small ribosomal subunit Rsm22 family protein [Gemmatimonadales bacterium]
MFPVPGPELTRGLEKFADALDSACSLRPKHRAALPGVVRQLSTFLTTDRSDWPRDYMTRPEYLSAYLRWFMPWNLFRQGILLQGLGLDLPAGSRIVDLGAGPLTFLLALWLGRPDLRDRSMEYIAVDRAEPALKAGRDLFSAMTGTATTNWKVRTERSLAGHGRLPKADLLVAANFLNELETSARSSRAGRGSARAGSSDEDEGIGGGLEDRILVRWQKQVTSKGAVLLIEPGTRPAGRQLVRMRRAALEQGWRVAAPCPHAVECPLPGARSGAWCHFTFSSEGAPGWLHKLARKVKLPKERASLSFLLLTRPDSPISIRPFPRVRQGEGLALVVSEPFELPDWKQGRYACSDRGLLLLEEKSHSNRGASPAGIRMGGLHPGDVAIVQWPRDLRRDSKSGALILPRASR